METWPYSVLPDPTINYSSDNRTSVVRTQMDSGRVRQRKRFSTDVKQIAVSWVLTNHQYQMFQSFHRFKLNLGADFFFMDHWFGDEPQQVKARFMDGAYASQYVDGRWMVSGTMEVEEVPVIGEGLYDVLLSGGPTAVADIEAAADSFHELVHTTLPSNSW